MATNPIRRSRPLERALAAFLLASLAAPAAAADDDATTFRADVDRSRVTRQERPFAFTVDPSTPSRGVLSVGYGFGLGSGISADRPLPVNVATPTGSHTFEAAYGVTDRFAPFVRATFAEVDSSNHTQTVVAGLTWQATRPGAPFRASFSFAGQHEAVGGANGVTALAAASLDEGPLRVAANLRGDKVFATDRDAVDYFVSLGASWRMAGFLRFGAEYVAQDLEELVSPEAEGGAEQAVGPTVALDLDGGRYQIALGSGFGIGAHSPRVVGRAAIAFNF